MIDLHSHILPGIDDGSPDVGISLAMARHAFDDGIRIMACTPHVVPGLYENTLTSIQKDVAQLQSRLEEESIGLKLVVGADVHLASDLHRNLGVSIPTLHNSRYFLFEPPHNLLPPGLENYSNTLLQNGFIPIITHPERLKWVEAHYDLVARMNDRGCLIQITAGAITGGFGAAAEKLALRFLEEGRIDVLATDTHNLTGRPPVLSVARDLVAKIQGEEEANAMVLKRPLAILKNEALEPVGKGAPVTIEKPQVRQGFFKRLKSKVTNTR